MRSLSTLTRGVALSGALTLSGASAASAASGGENTPLNLSGASTVHAASGGSSSGVLRTIIALVVVIGIIYAVARILRAVKGRSGVRASGSGLSQIASLPLGANRSVTAIRAGREVVLLGVAENGVTALRTYSEAEAIAAGIDVPADVASDPTPVERPLDRFLDGLRRMTVRP